MTLRAVVVGGSLGGLTLANLLVDAGATVTVLERSPVPLEGRGAGIVQHPTTVRYLLERAGVDLDRLSTPARWRRYVDADDRVLHEEDRGYRFTGYGALYAGLADALAGRADHRFDAKVIDIDVDLDTPTVTTADGGTVTGDLVVFADGVGGTGRSLLFGDRVVHTDAGYVAWRGFAPRAALGDVAAVLDDAITFHLMPAHRSHILTYPIPDATGADDLLVNFVWYRNVPQGPSREDLLTAADGSRRPTSVPPGLLAPHHEDAFRAHADAVLPPSMRALVEATEAPFLQVIADTAVPAMVRGRACVIGDGAFSVRPHTAAATAKAADDGWTLVEALEAAGAIADPTAVPAALASWEPGQIALGRQLLARARDLGHRSQVEGSWVPGDPSLAFGLHRAGDTTDAPPD